MGTCIYVCLRVRDCEGVCEGPLMMVLLLILATMVSRNAQMVYRSSMSLLTHRRIKVCQTAADLELIGRVSPSLFATSI